MINNDVLPVSRSRILRKTNKEGKIHKKDGNIPIEMKKYKMNELTALQGKYAKVDVELSLDEEKDSGQSIMINLNTMLFEVSKQNLLQYHKSTIAHYRPEETGLCQRASPSPL